MSIGVHPDKLMSPNSRPVVSVGRAIVDPYSREVLGFILLNISVEKLKTLWGEIPFTEHTSFYLVDDYHRIIYSKNKKEIGQPAADIIGENYVQVSEEQLEKSKTETT
ncbi:cache domain-containing protein [Paenibacillus catalpae]|uniref:cache domain-containing protein n=1 Tax=Paenibacillus catalpae TaxID=1045775 RepID=UPI001FE95886|nr:cache domain-containing protein [Paenibacillus catalpae]